MNPPRKARGTGKSSDEESETPTDAIELLKNDHREVEQLFERCKKADDGDQKERLVREIAAALFTHTVIEEEIFYPACREKGVDTGPLDEAQVEHDSVKMMVEELLDSDADEDEYYDAKIAVLSEYVKHHVNEEEKETDGIMSRAKAAGLDMNEIGGKLKARKREVKRREDRNLSRPEIRSLRAQQPEGGEMARRGSEWVGRSGYYAGEREDSGRGYYRDQDDDYRGYRGGAPRYGQGGDWQRRRQAGDNDIASQGYGRRGSGGRTESGRDYYQESGREGGRGGRGYSTIRRDIYGSARSMGDYDEDEYRDDGRRSASGYGSSGYGYRNYDESDDYSDYGRRGWNR